MPGTTRDYLSAELDLDGVICRLIDTAGIEEAKSKGSDEIYEIENAAQSAAWEQHRQATIRILCLSASQEPDEWEREQIEKSNSASMIVAITKIDVGAISNLLSPHRQVGNLSYIGTSSMTGEGIEFLRGKLRETILALGNAGDDVVAGTAARCRESLRIARESLHYAQTLHRQKSGEEFVAGEIRLALEELGRVAGAVYTDDVLDRIFSRFCVGK
jgi:tRNA modification GTPase